MTTETFYTGREVAAELQTYHRIVVNLAEFHEFPRRTASYGKLRLFTRRDIERLRPLVAAWKGRVRVTTRPRAPLAPAARRRSKVAEV